MQSLDKPFFSIIIPCFNSEQYLPDTLGSLGNQTCRDFEVILIDDNSTDQSFQVAKSILASYDLNAKVVKKDISLPKGVSHSRNLGLLMAQGDWIAFLDSDDLFFANKLETCKNIIEKNPGLKIIIHPSERFFDVTNEFNGYSTNLKLDSGMVDLSQMMLKENPIATCGILLERNFLEKINFFNTELNGVEDYLFFLKALRLEKAFYINEFLASIRIRKDSLMSFRGLPYYIDQYSKLIQQVSAESFLNNAELILLRRSLLKENLGWLISRSLRNNSHIDYWKGISALIRKGELSVAAYHLKRCLISWAAKYF